MKDDLHLEAVERSAFVGLFRVCRDLALAMISRGVTLKYHWDPESRQHAFEFSVHRDTPEGGAYHDPQSYEYSHRPPPDPMNPYSNHYYR